MRKLHFLRDYRAIEVILAAIVIVAILLLGVYVVGQRDNQASEGAQETSVKTGPLVDVDTNLRSDAANEQRTEKAALSEEEKAAITEVNAYDQIGDGYENL